MFDKVKQIFNKKAEPVSVIASTELGVDGAKISNGYVHDEFLPQLSGDKGRKTYREMRDNDSTVGAIIFAVEMVIRNVKWSILENVDTKGSKEAADAAKFVNGVLFEDMEHSWDDFMTDVLSFLTFGWEYTEVVFKRRLGSDNADRKHRSKFDDGAIGIRKLGIRAQETLNRWKLDPNGTVEGMYQDPPEGGGVRFIPMSKALLFRPHTHKGSPEGRSVLRNAYRSWYFVKQIQQIEAIAIERELNGFPVVKIPNAILNGTTDEAIAAKNKYIKLVRDIKFNEQGGVVLPSDPYFDADGKPTSIAQVSLELLSSTGTRAISTNEIILRYQRDIARTVMADFLMLGSNDRGSFAMSKDKSSLFIKAAGGWLNSIADTINKDLIPQLWARNGFDNKYMPVAHPGNIAPVDLEELGKYIERLAKSGAPLFPDDDLEEHLRKSSDLPMKGADSKAVPMKMSPNDKSDENIDNGKNKED